MGIWSNDIKDKILYYNGSVQKIDEIPDNIKSKLEIIPVRWIDKVLEVALVHQPTPLPAGSDETAVTSKAKQKDKKSHGVRAH